jgi:hypothetical protein
MKNEKCEYDNDGFKITSPGKFEGEPVFAPCYWQLGLEGMADDDDGKVFTFKISKAGNDGANDLRAWPTLKNWNGRR